MGAVIDEIADRYPPEKWPFRWIDYQGAAGLVTRRRHGDTTRQLAREHNVDPSSITRAISWYLKSTGQYSPAEWHEYRKARNRERRAAFFALVQARDHRDTLDREATDKARTESRRRYESTHVGPAEHGTGAGARAGDSAPFSR